MVDEVEQAFVRPLQVLEPEDERALLGHRLEEAPPGGKRFGAMVSLQLLCLEPHQRAEVPLYPVGLRLVDELANAGRELGCRLLGRIGLEDPCLCLHHLP